MLNTQAQRLLAEALGTLTLVLGGSLAVLGAVSSGPSPLVAISLGFGLALLAGLYAFGEISGGHFNPAVSFAMLLSRRLSPRDFVSYSAAQIVGAIAGSLAVLAAFSRDDVAGTANAIASGYSVWDAFWLEMIVSAVFVAVILQSSRSERVRGSALLAIPLALVLAHLALVTVTGCSVNPARSLGPAIVGGEWNDIWVFILAPLAGGLLAAIVHAALYPPYKEEIAVVEVTTVTL
jgi:aquaporin Z